MRLFLSFCFLLILSSSDFLHGNRGFEREFLGLPKATGAAPIREARAAISDAQTTDILADFESRVPQEFEVTPFWSPFVRFWFGIYTRYSTHHIVIHDKVDLAVVYGVLDFSRVVGPNINRFARSAIVQQISKEKMLEVKKVLKDLSRGDAQSRMALSILKVLHDSGQPPPADASARKKYFEAKALNIRTQTGQRDLIEAGIANMAPYAPFFRQLFDEFDLPRELLAIPFLESSFNNGAHSKVGALGIWQFMPLIASYFVPKRNDTIDYRLNPLIASVAALHLLRENKKILRSWDLAITAYNSGTKHLVKARRELGANRLEEILKRYSHPHLGFASKNFYAEFIALVHTIAYRNEIFPAEKDIATHDPKQLHLAISRCSFIPDRMKSKNWAKLNPHLRKPTRTYPRGTLVVSNDTSDKMFMRLTTAQISQTRPIDWQRKWLVNQSCSTR